VITDRAEDLALLLASGLTGKRATTLLANLGSRGLATVTEPELRAARRDGLDGTHGATR